MKIELNTLVDKVEDYIEKKDKTRKTNDYDYAILQMIHRENNSSTGWSESKIETLLDYYNGVVNFKKPKYKCNSCGAGTDAVDKLCDICRKGALFM